MSCSKTHTISASISRKVKEIEAQTKMRFSYKKYVSGIVSDLDQNASNK